MKTLREETRNRVRHLVLCRAAEYNTIITELRDELAAAIDRADDDPEVHAILLRAEGPAFCAGYGLDWATAAESQQTTYSEAERSSPASAGEARARSEAKPSEVHQDAQVCSSSYLTAFIRSSYKAFLASSTMSEFSRSTVYSRLKRTLPSFI